MQVRLLKLCHAKEYVGTVDKFQGQQAPVVIISMSSSNGNESARGLEFLFSKNRLNVAISRAKCLAIVVGHPGLAQTSCSKVEQMQLVNLFCRVVREAESTGNVLRQAAVGFLSELTGVELSKGAGGSVIFQVLSLAVVPGVFDTGVLTT